MQTEENPRGATGASIGTSDHQAAGHLHHSRELPLRVGPPCGCPMDHHECGVDLPLPPTLPNVLARRAAWWHLKQLDLLDSEGWVETVLADGVR